MDQQSRDWYLARWLVARGVCSEASITGIFHQGGDFVQKLQNASIIHPQLWELFLQEMESRGTSITPPSQSTMLRAFRSESKLPKIGEHFSGYELLSELGRGGMGAVFKARRLRDQKIFALKMILSGEDASEEHRERFRREIDAMRRLKHPNIARIYDSGTEGQSDFYTMDIIEQGRSLTKAVDEADGGLLQGVDFLKEVALALQYAHEQGVIHRDIKPSNIVIDGDRKPWIVDFGLVRDLDRVTKLTQSGAFLGTPSYMSPEQCVESSKVDARSDVYALGAILYEILAGRKPFESQSATALMAEILNKLPDPPSKLTHNVDHRLEAICLKALSKDPGKRYQSAKDFADDLGLARLGQRVSAQRSKTPLILAVTAGLLLFLTLGAVFIFPASPEGQIADSVLEAKARRWAPKLKELEKKLEQPGAVKISELSEALSLPSQATFEHGEMPKNYEVLLGRLACLEGEVALRLGDLQGSRNALKRAQKYLRGQSNTKRLVTLKTLIEINEERLTYEQAIQFLGRLIVLKNNRGDLLVLRARLHWKSKQYSQAIFDIEQAELKGFHDKRLKASILIAKGQYEEACLIIEKDKDWSYRQEDRLALFRSGSRNLKQNNPKLGLKRLRQSLDNLEDSQLKLKIRTFLWDLVKDQCREKEFERFTKLETFENFKRLAAFMDEHFGAEGLPKNTPRRLSFVASNLDGIKGDYDLRCFELYERACRWAPDDVDLWLRITSNKIAETIPTKAYRRLIKFRQHCIDIARTPSERVQFQAQFQRLYAYSGWFQQGINDMPAPTKADNDANPSWAADWCYWRGFSLTKLKKIDEALAMYQLAPQGFGEHAREISFFTGEILIAKGRIQDGIDTMLFGGRELTSSSKSKWQYLFRNVCRHSHKYPESILKLRSLLKERDSTNRYLGVIRVWIALNAGRWKQAETLISALIAKSNRPGHRRRLKGLLSIVKDSSNHKVPSKTIRAAYIVVVAGV